MQLLATSNGLVVDGGHDQITGVVQRSAGDFFMPGTNGNLINTAFRGFAGFAETTGQASQILQFKRNVFEDVTRPGPFLNAAQKTAMFTS